MHGTDGNTLKSEKIENKYYQEERKTKNQPSQNYNKQYNTNYNKSTSNNNSSFGNMIRRTILGAIPLLIVMALNLDIFEPEPEPEYDYNQIMENIESFNEDNQSDFDEILDDIELPDIENMPESAYWQSEYDFMYSVASGEVYNVTYYPGTHLVGLDIPAGDYELTVENYLRIGLPTSVSINGESLVIDDVISFSVSEGDIFQYGGGVGVYLYSTNHQSLGFLYLVAKNEEYSIIEIENEIIVDGEEIKANTYDITNPNYENVLIKIDYPNGYILSDFEILLTSDEYFFDNLILPEGTIISSDGVIMLEVSPFNVDSIIS